MIQDHQYLIKAVLVGNQGVGKSSIFNRICDDTFSQTCLSTIGVDFRFKIVEVNGNKVKIQLWDTAGQEKFRAMNSAYYRNVHMVLMVYDRNQRKSFEELESYWIQEVKNNIPEEEVLIYMIGNKNDLKHEVTIEEIQQFEKSTGVKNFLTSAKNGEGIDQLFQQVCRDCITKLKRIKVVSSAVQVNTAQVPKKKCCA